VRLDLLPPEAVTRREDGLIEIDWSAPDEWLEEEEPLLGHARDPVKIGGEKVADTRRAVALVETGLPTRWYIPRDDVSAELTRNGGHRTTCAYKGHATHWHTAGSERSRGATSCR
jgi:uncharacterized protein (DUF427 family)